jgi:integrase/recombinase XerD
VSTSALDRLLAEHDDWLAIERGLSRNTLLAYRRDLRGYAAFLRERGIDDPSAIGEDTVQAYVRALGRRKLAPASVARAVVAVRSFHRFCAREGFVDDDPSAAVGAPRVPEGIPKALDEDEVAQLLDGLAGDDARAQRDRALLELLYGTGIRISEAVGLDLDDLDLDEATVRVLGKGNKERVVPVGRSARAALSTYMRDGRLELSRGRARDALLLNARGGRISRQACWQIVQRAGEQAALGARLYPHVLRHSCATHMLEHGADLRVVQEFLGHASISTTQVYTKVSPTRLRAVYDAAHPRARMPAKRTKRPEASRTAGGTMDPWPKRPTRRNAPS